MGPVWGCCGDVGVVGMLWGCCGDVVGMLWGCCGAFVGMSADFILCRVGFGVLNDDVVKKINMFVHMFFLLSKLNIVEQMHFPFTAY